MVHTDTEQDSEHHIDAGMLFEEYSGQDDGHVQDTGTSDCPFFILELRRVYDRHVCGDGVEHMYARKNIGGCICPVQETYHLDEDIIPVKFQRAEQMSVGIDRRYDQEQRHARVQECNIAEEIVPVSEEEPQEYGCNVHEPEKVRDDKIFTEWNVIIQRKMDDMVGLTGAAFQPEEPDQIKYKIGNRPYMRIFAQKSLKFCCHIYHLMLYAFIFRYISICRSGKQ